MTTSRNLFLNTPPVRLFFTAALPGAAGMLASILYFILDGVLVGNILGTTAFAAVSLGLPFIIINFSIPRGQFGKCLNKSQLLVFSELRNNHHILLRHIHFLYLKLLKTPRL